MKRNISIANYAEAETVKVKMRPNTKSDYDRMLDDLNSGVTQPAESFIDTVQRMSDWAAKVHEKAMRQRREDIEKQRCSYYDGAR